MARNENADIIGVVAPATRRLLRQDLVDDEKVDATQLGQLGGESPSIVGGLEAGDPVHRGGERDAVPGLSSLDRQPDGQVGLAGSRWAEQHHIAGLGHERTRAQVGNHVPVECGLVVEVEVLQRLTCREPRRADAGRRAGSLAGGD
jgi:hypothetical protein